MKYPFYLKELDSFILKIKNKKILFQPLSKLISSLTKEQIGWLKNKKNKINAIQKKQIINLKKEAKKNVKKLKKTINFNKNYAPSNLVLLPTNGCNLDCKYCYANAGKNEVMSLRLAKKAILYCIKNAKKQKKDLIELTLHGGGEPTFAWDLYKKIVLFSKEKIKKEKKHIQISTITNGILNKKQILWIVKNTSSIMISIDGLKKHQDYHRPLRNKKSSFNIVFSTIKEFEKYNFPIAIRTTITDYNLKDLEKIYNFYKRKFKVDNYKFFQLSSCSKCSNNNLKGPNYNIFYKKIDKLLDKSVKDNKYLKIIDIDKIKFRFCGLENNFILRWDDKILSCLAISDYKNHKFIIGEYSNKKRKFVINNNNRKKIFRLWKNRLKNECKICIAKYYCGGSCILDYYHKNINKKECSFYKNIILKQIEMRFNE